MFDVIASSKKFPEDESRLMIKHLSSALAYLHNRRIVHRDIKPENLLVRLDENKKVRSVKLGDFGLAQVVTEPLYSVCGTPTYVAPEILSESGYELKVITTKLDFQLQFQFIFIYNFKLFILRSTFGLPEYFFTFFYAVTHRLERVQTIKRIYSIRY